LLKSISELYETFEKMKEYLNVCGEGGEYESLVLDSPLHKSKIVIDEFDIIDVSKDDYAPVSYCIIRKMHLEPKELFEEIQINSIT